MVLCFLVAAVGEEGTKMRFSSSEVDSSDSESLCSKALTRASVLFLISLAVLSFTCRSVSLGRLTGIKEHQQTPQTKQYRLRVDLKKAVVRQLVCLRWTNKRKEGSKPSACCPTLVKLIFSPFYIFTVDIIGLKYYSSIKIKD